MPLNIVLYNDLVYTILVLEGLDAIMTLASLLNIVREETEAVAAVHQHI